MFCIGGAILLAMLVLMAVVICLYNKVANALNGSTPQCCDECNLYPSFDALPPCYCNVNEGL
ncbi:protein FAM24B [Moschus berezovskii]|uniref:protein FAM24B n=1 Tax=Moschus berezovskii TaxID=68408 RepID=UPI0024437E84|nr:protein FAM24B [Moschus berezovskii]